LIYFRILNIAVVTIWLTLGYAVYLIIRPFKESSSSTGKAVSVLIGIVVYLFLIRTILDIITTLLLVQGLSENGEVLHQQGG
jgi:hypothetical protein